MRFRNEDHKEIFMELLNRMKKQDCYHQAVAYLLALDEVVVHHIPDVFDFEEDAVKTDTALGHGWQTGTSRKTTRLLMNLWNGWCWVIDKEGLYQPDASYAVDEVFCCGYAPYYWEAIRLRYPEYSAG